MVGHTNTLNKAMHEPIEQRPDILIEKLLHNPNPSVRLSCGIKLMKDLSAPVTLAYRCALEDASDKVVQLSCMELGWRGGVENTEALLRVLNHKSWHVRLGACKALITQGVTDHRITNTIEALAQEPEAAIYDAECDDLDRMIEESGMKWPCEMWGKLNTILSGPQTS